MLADSLITAILDSRDGSFLQSHLGVYICALFHEVALVRTPNFAAKLSPINRPFHHDGVKGMIMTTIPSIKRQRTLRDKARESGSTCT
jgi:hypothetical protein